MTPLGYYHESNVKSDTAFIISAGAAGELGYSGVDFWAADDVYYFLTSENLKSKFSVKNQVRMGMRDRD